MILRRVFEVLEKGDWIRSSYLRGAILRGSIRMVGSLVVEVIPGVLKVFVPVYDSFHLWNLLDKGNVGGI